MLLSLDSPLIRSHRYTPITQEDASPLNPPSRTLGIPRSNSLIRSLSPSPALVTHPHYNTHASLHPSRPSSTLESRAMNSDRDASFEHDYALDSDLEQENAHEQGHELDHEYVDLGAPRLTSLETARLAATFCIVWFAANWTVNASLGLTSVGSSTVLAGMSGEPRSKLPSAHSRHVVCNDVN
jgi:hypothetical protein